MIVSCSAKCPFTLVVESNILGEKNTQSGVCKCFGTLQAVLSETHFG